MTYLPPEGEYQYGTMKRKTNLAYSQGLAQNEFNLGNQAQNYAQQRQNLIREYGEMRNKAPYKFNQRGLMRSGVYSGGLQQMQQAHLRQLQQAEQTNTQQVGGLQLARQGLEQTRGSELGDAEQWRQAQMQQIALKKYLMAIGQAGLV